MVFKTGMGPHVIVLQEKGYRLWPDYENSVSSVLSSLVIIRRFALISWLRRSSFCELTAVQGRPECGLSFTSLLPLLKCCRLTVLKSTVWSQYTFSKQQWLSVGAWRNSLTHLCFVCTSMSDAILPDCSSAAICRMGTKLTNYWWEGSTSIAILPESASNFVGQHNKIRRQYLLNGVILFFSSCVF
jgi:hypothetical protein